MKRYVRSSDIDGTMYREIKKSLSEEFGSDNPGTGNSYIAEDGTYIQLYPKIDTHEDICYWIHDNFDVEIDCPDEEWAIREFNWIRLRRDPSMSIVELTSNRPTNSQLYALEDWLEWSEGKGRSTLYMSVCDSPTYVDVEYELGKDVFAEDVMKMISRYYATGRIYASTYTFDGNVSDRFGNLLGRMKEQTTAPSLAKAKSNIQYKLKKRLGKVPNYVLNIDDKDISVEMPKREYKKCPECGRILTDGGYCPFCDDGYEDED